MDVMLAEVAGSAVFLQSPAPYMLLDRRLRIRGVNRAYARATGRSAEELTGMDLFEAFPDNPADPGADGVAQLSASLERVLRAGRADDMVVQRYDIPCTTSRSGFTERVWSPVNSPITDVTGRAVGVLHHVEDITVVRQLAGWDPYAALVDSDGAALLPSVPAALASVLRSRLRQVASIVAHARAEQDILQSQSGRLADALIQVLASRGIAGPSPMQTRREHLWRAVVDRARRPGWHGWAHALCATVVQEVPGVRGAALSLCTAAGAYELLAASDRWARQLDELPLTVGEGPAVCALATGLPVLVPDLATQTERWPGYAEAAACCGLAAVHAFPVGAFGVPVATLSMFGRGVGPLGASGAADAAILAHLAGAVVTQDLDGAVADAVREVPAARGPWADIAVASGIVSARHRLSVDDALARLRAAAYAREVPLAGLAAAVISGQATLD